MLSACFHIIGLVRGQIYYIIGYYYVISRYYVIGFYKPGWNH